MRLRCSVIRTSPLPPALEPVARWLVVTPQMHQVHHSIERAETDSNFGFNLPWWDRLFGTYRAAPAAGEQGITIGLPIFRDPANCASIVCSRSRFVTTRR